MSDPSLPQPSSPSPFYNSESSNWKRNLLIGVIAVVLVGGAVRYYTGEQEDSYYYSASETTSTTTTYDDEQPVEGYDSDDYYSNPYAYTDEEYDIFFSEAAGYYTFVDYYYGFQMDYPETWYLEPAADMTFFTSPYEDYYDTLYENVSLVTEDVSDYPDITLEDYAAIGEEILAEDPAYAHVETGYRSVGVYDGMYVLGNYDLGGGQSAGLLSVFTIQNHTVYLMSYMYELPSKEAMMTIFDTMLGSFELLSVAPASVSDDADFADIPEEDLGFASLLHLQGF